MLASIRKYWWLYGCEFFACRWPLLTRLAHKEAILAAGILPEERANAIFRPQTANGAQKGAANSRQYCRLIPAISGGMNNESDRAYSSCIRNPSRMHSVFRSTLTRSDA
jgi:hypothetical protein